MKKTTMWRKLALHRQDVRVLTADALTHVDGGVLGGANTFAVSCRKCDTTGCPVETANCVTAGCTGTCDTVWAPSCLKC